MRVAHFIQRYPPALGGSEAYFARLSRFLTTAGDDVQVFTSTALDLEAFWSLRGRCLPAGRSVEEGVTVRRYPLYRWPGRRYFLKPLSLVPIPVWQCLTLPCNPLSPGMWAEAGRSAEAFDIVHVSAFPYAFPLACGRRLAKRLGIPLVVTPFLHLGDVASTRDDTRRAYLSAPLRFLLREADAVLVQTQLEYDAVVRQGVSPERVVVQGMGVDPAVCTGGARQRTRQSWNAADGEVVVGHLANQSAEKGTIDLLQAAEQLWKQGSAFRVVLAGPEMPNFRRFWQSYLPRERVSRLGVLSDVEKRDFFAAIDLFALPSRSDSFGLVLLEAWANGAANIAYRAGGVAELIHDNEDGVLVPCGDRGELARGLAALVNDATLRQRLGEAGRRRAQAEFRWSDKLGLVRDLYARIAGDKTKRAAEELLPPPLAPGTTCRRSSSP